MGIVIPYHIILASASPRRIELLKLAGLSFDVIPADIEEAPRPEEAPDQHVLRLAAEKALFVAAEKPDCLVIGADTIVFLDGEILGKPANREEAQKTLAKLSGQTHEVFTGFFIAQIDRGIRIFEAVRSAVTFREITPDEISWYAGTPEPYDKAGAYAAQGISASFIRKINGSYTNVIGLPLCEVVEKLKTVGAIDFSQDS
ncbi:MAG: Maf family protein [Syntrophales bacterium]|jgi:septum formation protein|nr:Maf family protein [Syntrophales bacterium]